MQRTDDLIYAPFAVFDNMFYLPSSRARSRPALVQCGVRYAVGKGVYRDIGNRRTPPAKCGSRIANTILRALDGILPPASACLVNIGILLAEFLPPRKLLPRSAQLP